MKVRRAHAEARVRVALEIARAQAPVLAVLNMKGGVGKTTIAANVFDALYRKLALRILLVDFDPQFNLSQLLRSPTQYQKLLDEERTLWHVMTPPEAQDVFQVSEDDMAKPRPHATYVEKLKGRGSGQLDLLAGDFKLAKLSLRESATALRVPRLRLGALLDDARNAYDLIVLDCNPSSSFMTRCAIENAAFLLVPVRPDKYSMQGLVMMSEYVSELPGLKREPETLILLNDINRRAGMTETEADLRGDEHYGDQTLANVVYSTGLLRADVDPVGFATDQGKSWTTQLRTNLNEVAVEIASKIGIEVD